eukprot:TRINITY_DN5381_c0_g1_i8.p1 TRINITY_DN5381_c0_g1~~TRINITY_DN5381_c0_g1_i8.p1  ORF type:complete len:634 (-),score=225.78 TRINITY_DN5381_c0_g1_i8:321-2222(-)
MIRRPPRSTLSSSSAASDVYKRQVSTQSTGPISNTMVGTIEGYSGLNVDELVAKGQRSFHEADLDHDGVLSKNEVKKYVKADTGLRALFHIEEGWQRFWQMMDDADEGIALRVSQGTERFFDEGDFVSAIVKSCREEGLITQAQEEQALSQPWFTEKKWPTPESRSASPRNSPTSLSLASDPILSSPKLQSERPEGAPAEAKVMYVEGYSGLNVDELVAKGQRSFHEADLDHDGVLSKNEVKKYVKADTGLRALFHIEEGWQRFWQMMDDADEGIALRVSQGTERFFDEGDFVSAIVKSCREEGLITQAQEEQALSQPWFTQKKFPTPEKRSASPKSQSPQHSAQGSEALLSPSVQASEEAKQARVEEEAAAEQARIEAAADEQARMEKAAADEQARMEKAAADEARRQAAADEQARMAKAEADEQARLEAEASKQARSEAAAEQTRMQAAERAHIEAAEQARMEKAAADEQARVQAEGHAHMQAVEEQARKEKEAAEQAREDNALMAAELARMQTARDEAHMETSEQSKPGEVQAEPLLSGMQNSNSPPEPIREMRTLATQQQAPAPSSSQQHSEPATQVESPQSPAQFREVPLSPTQQEVELVNNEEFSVELEGEKDLPPREQCCAKCVIA